MYMNPYYINSKRQLGSGLPFQRYSEEQHVPQMTKNGLKTGSYIGPKTRLLTRLQSKNPAINLPISETDKISQLHDIEYTLAKDVNMVREADLNMLKRLKKVEDKKLDYKVNIFAGKNGIRAKLAGETIGILQKGSFANYKEPKNFTEDEFNLLVENKRRLQNYYRGLGYKIGGGYTGSHLNLKKHFLTLIKILIFLV